MATQLNSPLQQMLRLAVQGVQWTYSLFWQLCPQQGILVWGDGYYNGAIKTRKTVQPVEVSNEEASVQRSQQLRELYESLTAADTNQASRRPCAALSPEDLTESEWFYLMCISFSFPSGVGLPGKALARKQYVWLTGANEADSKDFTRAILAKSAGIQTVVCVPVLDGILELGTTERVSEDITLIQLAKSFFLANHLQFPQNPALSEHSTSNPISTSDQRIFSSLSFPGHAMSAVHPPLPQVNTNQQDDNYDYNEDEDDNEDDDKEEEDSESDHERSRSRRNEGTVNSDADPCAMTQAPMELIQLEMSEDIRFGTPEDCSNNFEPDMQIISFKQNSSGRHNQNLHHQPESSRTWPLMQNELDYGFTQNSGIHEIQDITGDDGHYSQTVSTVLEHNSRRSTESSSSGQLECSQYSAFSKWNHRSNRHFNLPQDVESQWTLKYMLFNVPFLHGKYRNENSARSKEGDNMGRLRKVASQDELSANHVLAERRRREKLNERFIILRSLVPFVTKMDKASILGDTIEYVKQLRRRIQDLETEQQKRRGEETRRDNVSQSNISQNSSENFTGGRVGGSEKRKIRVIEDENMTLRTKEVEAQNLQVSIIESDALLEIECTNKEGLLLQIMQILAELRLEVIGIHSSVVNGRFQAEIRAKVKENVNGRKATIMEVKRAIHRILSQH